MIITRYIFREITGVWLAITLVLLLIFAGNQLVMLFNAVVAGELIGKQVLVMLALTLVNNLALLLPFAFFIAIIVALGRMHRDSEMIALAACGVGLGHLLRIVGLFSMVLAAIIGTLSLWLSPWAEYRMQRLKDEAKSVTEIGGIPVGTFRSFGTETGEGVFYVEKVDPQRGRLKEVFVQMPGEMPLQQQPSASMPVPATGIPGCGRFQPWSWSVPAIANGWPSCSGGWRSPFRSSRWLCWRCR